MTDKIFNFLINYFSNINDGGVDEMNNFRGDITSDEIVEWLKNIQTSSEQPSEDLEEASNKYANDHTGLCIENDGGLYEDFDKPKRDFIAGANWQKEQMMKSAFDATCVLLPPPDVFKVLICHEVTDKLTVGQKVKVIVKEDEQ
jgi:hypothetical protein